MRRRQFITLLGGAAAWPLAARAQQPAMPVIGYLSTESPQSDASSRLAGLRRGMNQTGYVEGRNVAIEYRWGQLEQLHALAAELVQLQVTVIVAAGVAAALAAKAATTSIPIVFIAPADPVQFGLVTSLNRPGGNLTGFNAYSGELGAKGLALLHEVIPGTATVGFLLNPNSPISELMTKDLLTAALTIGLKVEILKAGTDSEIDAAFESAVQTRTGGLLVQSDSLFIAQVERVAGLAARYRIPTMYSLREFVLAGGLISYGTSLTENWRQIGLYVGRILKGEKPTDLPVIQPTKFELVINLKTARAFNLQIPDKLLALADDVIE
jgi:putative ABC transport system substrate-binding protein